MLSFLPQMKHLSTFGICRTYSKISLKPGYDLNSIYIPNTSYLFLYGSMPICLLVADITQKIISRFSLRKSSETALVSLTNDLATGQKRRGAPPASMMPMMRSFLNIWQYCAKMKVPKEWQTTTMGLSLDALPIASCSNCATAAKSLGIIISYSLSPFWKQGGRKKMHSPGSCKKSNSLSKGGMPLIHTYRKSSFLTLFRWLCSRGVGSELMFSYERDSARRLVSWISYSPRGSSKWRQVVAISGGKLLSCIISNQLIRIMLSLQHPSIPFHCPPRMDSSSQGNNWVFYSQLGLAWLRCGIEIRRHHNYRLMIFDKDLQDRPVEEDLPFYEMKNQLSTIYTNARLTPYALPTTPFPSFAASCSQWTQFETSLDRELYQHNAGMLRTGIVGFLRHCLARPIQEEAVFQDGNIFCFEGEDSTATQEGLLEALLDRNTLLTPQRKKLLTGVLDQYSDLTGLLRELKQLCGRSITQEVVCILGELLDQKLGRLEQLQDDDLDGLLPRMDRFWGVENDERVVRGGWNVYNEVDYDSVKRVAADNVQKMASSLYFGKRIRHLSLGSVAIDSLADVNLLDKFTSLVGFLSQGLLLGMEGISQREEAVSAFISDLQYTTAADGAVESRSSKKIKSDDL